MREPLRIPRAPETTMASRPLTAPASSRPRAARLGVAAAGIALMLLSACGGNDDAAPATLPRLAAAQPGTLANCASLSGFAFGGTTIASATPVAANAVTSTADGVTLALPAHCVVVGKMNPRTGIDGKPYAINFEMRLPNS